MAADSYNYIHTDRYIYIYIYICKCKINNNIIKSTCCTVQLLLAIKKKWQHCANHLPVQYYEAFSCLSLTHPYAHPHHPPGPQLPVPGTNIQSPTPDKNRCLCHTKMLSGSNAKKKESDCMLLHIQPPPQSTWIIPNNKTKLIQLLEMNWHRNGQEIDSYSWCLLVVEKKGMKPVIINVDKKPVGRIGQSTKAPHWICIHFFSRRTYVRIASFLSMETKVGIYWKMLIYVHLKQYLWSAKITSCSKD